MNNYVENFLNAKEQYENCKKTNVAMKLDYLINQTHTLYNIIDKELLLTEDLRVNNVKFVSEETDEIDPHTGEEILNKIIDNVELSDKYYDITLGAVVKEELESYGLSLDYAGCKFIIDLCEKAPKLGLTKDSSYDEILTKMCSNKVEVNTAKRNLTFIRKKANFNNAEYLSILRVMKSEDITNEVLLKNFIELCY